MRIKFKTKLSIISIFICILLVSGIIMFRGLLNNKQVFESDLYNYLPTNISSILQVNKEKDIESVSLYFEEFSPILSTIGSNINYPLLITEYQQNNFLIMKVTVHQEEIIKELLDNTIYASFPPKEKTYKDHKLYFYITPNNNFFICTFIDGVFIGGFNLFFFEKYIDNKAINSKGIIEIPIVQNILENIKTSNSTNLFLNNNKYYSIFNVNFHDEKIKIEGNSSEININNWICKDNNIADTLRIDKSLFNNKLVAYMVDMSNPIITDSIKCLFSAPSYTFYSNKHSKPVYALKHNKDKMFIYNLLNKMEESYVGHKFEIKYFNSQFRFYTTSKQLAKDIFNIGSPVYLTFSNGYLFFSEDKDVLITYLMESRSSSLNEFLSTNQKEEPLDKIIFSKDLNIWSPIFFSPINSILQKNSKNIYITSSLKDKKNTYRIILTNNQIK